MGEPTSPHLGHNIYIYVYHGKIYSGFHGSSIHILHTPCMVPALVYVTIIIIIEDLVKSYQNGSLSNLS